MTIELPLQTPCEFTVAWNGDFVPRRSLANFRKGQAVLLVDQPHGVLAKVVIDEIDGDRLLGFLEPTASYAAVKTIFDEHVEAVNDQCFAYADELETAIAKLGVRFETEDRSPLPPIYDVQIGGTHFSCRISLMPN